MRSERGSYWRQGLILFFILCLLLVNYGCSLNAIQRTGARILQYHFGKSLGSVEEITKRLYAKNPKYERDLVKRQAKIDSIFMEGRLGGEFSKLSSEKILTSAFAPEPLSVDRVYLLSLGMAKGIREAYGLEDNEVLVVGLQVELKRLESLHYNLKQVNWRLKTAKDENGVLIFLTNAVGDAGYINMGFEVIMTEILTRVEDDIYLLGGLPAKYIFDVSTMFLSILL